MFWAEGRVSALKLVLVTLGIFCMYLFNAVNAKRLLRSFEGEDIGRYYRLATSLNNAVFSAFTCLDALCLFFFGFGLQEDIVLISTTYYIGDLIFRFKVIEKEFVLHHLFFILPSVVSLKCNPDDVRYMTHLATLMEFSTFPLSFRDRYILFLSLLGNDKRKEEERRRYQFRKAVAEFFFVIAFIFRLFIIAKMQIHSIYHLRNECLFFYEYFGYLLVILNLYWAWKILRMVGKILGVKKEK